MALAGLIGPDYSDPKRSIGDSSLTSRSTRFRKPVRTGIGPTAHDCFTTRGYRISALPWHVEAIGEDGEIYVAVFFGPEARERATEYADWKNGKR